MRAPPCRADEGKPKVERWVRVGRATGSLGGRPRASPVVADVWIPLFATRGSPPGFCWRPRQPATRRRGVPNQWRKAAVGVARLRSAGSERGRWGACIGISREHRGLNYLAGTLQKNHHEIQLGLGIKSVGVSDHGVHRMHGAGGIGICALCAIRVSSSGDWG